MKTIYLCVTIIVTSIAFTSCTAESVSENVPTNQAVATDTGGQTGNVPIKP